MRHLTDVCGFTCTTTQNQYLSFGLFLNLEMTSAIPNRNKSKLVISSGGTKAPDQRVHKELWEESHSAHTATHFKIF